MNTCSRNQNAVPRKSILKTVNQRRSDGEERSGRLIRKAKVEHVVPSTCSDKKHMSLAVRFAAIDENSEPFMAQSRRNKIDHRPGSGRNTSSRFFKFEKPLKYHPLHQLDTNVIDEVPNISDNEIGDFDDFILQHGDGDGFDAPEAFEEGDLHERNGQDGQGIFFKKVTKPRGPPNQRLRALMAARQSLMDQGLGQGDGGVRRSKRTRVRPLEYWRNEKVVYGRQYRSLPTIADVEFKSPDPEWPKPKTKNRQKKSAEGEERIA